MLNNLSNNKITQLFNIQYPIVQAGMIWVSGWRLASAVSNAGGLGIIGAGSMYPSILEEHIVKCKAATNKPFGVNLPLLYPDIQSHINTIIHHKFPLFLQVLVIPKHTPKHYNKMG
jgi:enoyl-[acyl-carrier protein] reductase II